MPPFFFHLSNRICAREKPWIHIYTYKSYQSSPKSQRERNSRRVRMLGGRNSPRQGVKKDGATSWWRIPAYRVSRKREIHRLCPSVVYHDGVYLATKWLLSSSQSSFPMIARFPSFHKGSLVVPSDSLISVLFLIPFADFEADQSSGTILWEHRLSSRYHVWSQDHVESHMSCVSSQPRRFPSRLCSFLILPRLGLLIPG